MKRGAILFSVLLTFSLITISPALGFSNQYPKEIPSGYKKELKGKWRVIEHNNNRHFLIYDANKIERLKRVVKLFPPVYAQEHFMGVWYEEIYNEVVETIYLSQNISVIGSDKVTKQAEYPSSRQPIQQGNDPVKTFWNLLSTSVQLSGSKTKFFSAVSETNPGTVKITVTDKWHYLHKQQRLQLAQSVWEMWARIYSPKNLDKARISLVDYRDNEVGGSRIFGGSLIWVQD